MNCSLPIGIESLLSGAVESSRLELKASWDEQTTGLQVLKTLCAFANDLQNLNGGYVVIGVQECGGIVVRPVAGLSADTLETAQKWIRGNCNRIEPAYMPIIDTPELDGKRVLVLWAPASDIRPHQTIQTFDSSRGERKYFVRIGNESVIAKDEILTRLMQQTARIPFDDRRAFHARNEDLRISLVREFLHDIRSDLLGESDADRIYTAMHLTRKQNGHSIPRNVSLLFFSEDPVSWFRCARIEVAQFSDDAGGNNVDEKRFAGPIHHQIRQCLGWLENQVTQHFEKQASSAIAKGWVSYPNLALREALVNAIYHRSYEEDTVEPTKIYLYPNRVEVISYPGPVDGIEHEHFQPGAMVPPVPARNRRIGEFLKELRLAEARGTGLPKIIRSMRENGSPQPRFDFDAKRSYFRVTLPAHPEYVALAALRESAYFKVIGDDTASLRRLETAYEVMPNSSLIAAKLIEELAIQGNKEKAKHIYGEFCKQPHADVVRVVLTMATVLLDMGHEEEAQGVLDKLPNVLSPAEAIHAAISQRRANQPQEAHQLFLKAGESAFQDPKSLHEFAQTKMDLASFLHRKRSRDQKDREVNRQLLREAEELLERVILMDAPVIRKAWSSLHLAQVRSWLGKSKSDINEALEKAKEWGKEDSRLQKQIQRIQQQGGKSR